MSKGLEDCKFICKIRCEPRIAVKQDVTTITQKIIGVRVKMFDETTKELLKQIAEEKGYTELLVVDESKVDNFVKSLKALEIIKNKQVAVDELLRCTDCEDYNDFAGNNGLTQEEYDLLKEVLL